MSIDLDIVLFNVSAFICAVFVLDYGADKFIDHTVILAKRLHLSETLIALLTAGAEWEELIVVIAAIMQGKPALAIGNIIGSCISNILGAFSLGLLFRPIERFDKSARIYSMIQLVVTASVGISLVTTGPTRMGKIGGGFLIGAFILYNLSIGWGIFRGFVTAPENDDNYSDDSAMFDEASSGSTSSEAITSPASSTDNLLSQAAAFSQKKGERSSAYHIFQIVIGFVALSLSGYVLSHAASTLASALNLSDTVVGLTVLAFATTLPEKFVAFMSGWRRHSGILVAITAGSNIFLLTLCIGVSLFGRPTTGDQLRIEEVSYLIASTAAFTAMVWLGTRRWMGVLMILAYAVFMVLEFTIWRR